MFTDEDTLQGGVPELVPRHGGGVEAHSTGELAHELILEVLSALILFTTVDKDFVLEKSTRI